MISIINYMCNLDFRETNLRKSLLNSVVKFRFYTLLNIMNVPRQFWYYAKFLQL